MSKIASGRVRGQTESGDGNTAQAELEEKAGTYTPESNIQAPAFGGVKKAANPIKKLKHNSRGLTK